MTAQPAAADTVLDPFAEVRFRIPPPTVSEQVSRLADPSTALILRDLTERVTSYESTNPDPTGKTPTEKDFATVRLDIHAADGSYLGYTEGAGRMLYRLDSTDTFVAYYGETIHLADGNVVRSGGLVDDARLTAGEWASFPAVVVAGPLTGAIGFRVFRPLVKEAHHSYESAIVLYRPDVS